MSDDGLAAIRQRFGAAVLRVVTSCGQTQVHVDNAQAHAVLEWLQTDPEQQFDYLTDITCIEYRDPELPLEVVYQLRSLSRRVCNKALRPHWRA